MKLKSILEKKIYDKINSKFYPVFKNLAFKIDAEIAHDLTLKSMHLLGPWVKNIPSDERFQVKAMGLKFKSPIGLAAGLDKNAVAINFLTYLPFSFVEVGTVTPLPQLGNSKPRLFRYVEEESLRNCMGFNNAGADIIAKNLQQSDRREKIIGVNLGKNKLTPNDEAFNDYAILYEKFSALADYQVINISSPNTPGLRDLLQDSNLRNIFQAVTKIRNKKYCPLLVKVSPDMSDAELSSVVNLVKEFKLNGIIATNTTIMTERGAGGVSGKLLFEKARRTRQFLLDQLKDFPEIELIGVGGFSSYDDCREFWKMGGKLIQLYSSFVFQGPQILYVIEKQLAQEMTQKKINNFEEFRKSL